MVKVLDIWPTQKKIKKFRAFPYLLEKYGDWLRPEITEINLLHELGVCYLEVVSKLPEPIDPNELQTLVKKIDLSFIDCFDRASESIFDDARLLIEEFDPFSIVNTLPLFSDVVSEAISKYHGAAGK